MGSEPNSMENTHLDPNRPSRPSSEPQVHLRSLGGYRLLRPLGEGGMGLVFLGYSEAEDRQVAIKILGDHLASNQSFVDRFYREANSGSLLNHPNIVRSLNVGRDEASGKHYLVLEYVDGVSARALLDRHKRLSVGDGVHIALDIARALEHAHSRNVVHRDIKPDNILITRSGVAKLADMGLAKRTDETSSHLTAARQGFGTPHYMPYEQAVNARRADGRSDIYALGATLYHLITGEVPFSGDSTLMVVEKKSIGNFLPASDLNAEVPPLLEQILERMLARDPWDRYQTASELIIDLERSHLAAPVLSFADPDLALQDPYVRAYLATTAQPTQMDLASASDERSPGPSTRYVVSPLPDVRWQLPHGEGNHAAGPTAFANRPAAAGHRSGPGRTWPLPSSQFLSDFPRRPGRAPAKTHQAPHGHSLNSRRAASHFQKMAALVDPGRSGPGDGDSGCGRRPALFIPSGALLS